MKKESKRVTALTMSAMLMLNITATAVPVSAESGSKVYTHDGYTVEYTIKNEWTGNQNIEVTITNTGDDVLSGWAMGYNAFGEIGGLWNAKIYGHQGTEYILSSAGYNDELAPGQSTNFGYTLTGNKFKIPQNIVNCAERVDITEGYNVYYNITGDYGDTYQAEMVIENLSDTDINAWQLNFDGNASIDNLWNGKLLENNNGSFKVKNAENNSVIAAGDSASFNFSGRKLDEEAGSDVIETSAPATEPAAETTVVTDVSETDIAVGESETESISESEFVTERETVTEPATVIEQESETKTEVVFGNFKLTGVVIPMEFDFEIDPEIDSDEDGLPDYLEKEIGTDRYNADTDGDGLPDGYEYFTLGTDPKKADSDDNGISDADEDFDEDRLTNLEEYELGTDPFSKDTDYDGLSDYDEVKIHNTDPLKYDTDGDKVSDGDEIELGLDPNNPATNGYPDNEYTTKQTVGEDSSALDYINTIEDNPYTVSVEITAAGVAKNNLSAGESGYSYSILQNDAVLGVVPELSYSDGLSVTDVVIKFKLDDSAVGNKLGVYADEPEFNGIKRLQVFKYFEDNNILLPIETFYDEETKTVYTHVDELGTYCLMDMEMWINYLENLEPGNYYEEDDEVKSANIAFCLDTRYISDESSFDSVKSDMKAIAEDAFDRYTDVKVYVYYQEMGMSFRAKDNLLMDKDGNKYFTSYEEAKAAIDGMSMPKKSVAYDLVHASNYMIDLCDRSCKAEELDKNIITMYHIANDDNIVGSVNDSKQLIRTVEESAYTDENDEQAYRINVSVICPNGTAKENSYVRKLVDASKGIFYSDSTSEVQVMTLNAAENTDSEPSKVQKTNVGDAVNTNIVEVLGEGDGRYYSVITSTGLVKGIILDTPLRSNDQYTKKNKVPTDTDKDGIYDWDEVNTEFILNLDKNANISDRDYIIASQLPTIEEMINEYDWRFYVKNVYGKVYSYKASHLKEKSIFILPIISDPTSIDSDDDGFLDNAYVNYYENVDEKDKITYEWVKQSDEYFNVSDHNPLKKEIIWQWPVVSAEAVESYVDSEGNTKYRSKVDENGKKLVFKDEYKYKRLQASFDEIRRGNKPHRAIDITIDKNEYINKPENVKYYVIAAYGGKVVYTYGKCKSYNDLQHTCACNSGSGYGGYGNCIEIESNIDGVKFKTLYAHLSPDELLVQNGEYINAGEIIAIVGSSGSSSGKHLDFSIIEGSGNHTYGPYVDPVLFTSYYKSENGKEWLSVSEMYNFFMNVPKKIQYTCDDKCNECISYEKKIDAMYKLN